MTNSIAEPAVAALRPFERIKPLYRKSADTEPMPAKGFNFNPQRSFPP